ncbi:MAG: urease accessory protein UreE [Hyphomicrobiales bacterium]|nr:MAG: urease accessory protein UreE [Hyphomicrobiales bacterium]
MIKAHEIAKTYDKAADTITLDETARNRRRIKMVSDGGITFLLDLPHAQLLRHGAGIVLDDGRIIEVRAQSEDLYEVRGRDAQHLLQLAWQLGNRHLPAQIFDKGIRIRQDHVIKEMLLGLGAKVDDIVAPFDPEGGAYEGKQTASHDHAHSHSHAHSHHHHEDT